MARKGATHAQSSTGSNTATSVTSTATLIKAANENRIAALIYSVGAATAYYGYSSAVTAATGIPIPTDKSYVELYYTGTLYAITSTGTADVRVAEVG